MAAQENHAEVVKYLLASGANQALCTEVSTVRAATTGTVVWSWLYLTELSLISVLALV
jgi:hypothetical protein